ATLVQCNAGQSRSASIVAAYLTMHRGFKFSDALATVREARAPQRDVIYWEETLKAMRPLVGEL
ncbi:MAG: Dual specificity phosphatase, catalytic domain, partial [Pseudomonadota bacterium]